MYNSHSIFFNRCYEQLNLIPKGKVTTYAQIAKSLNSKAYRIVGTAMAKNPSPILLPCHRVVRSDGMIGNYIFGINKKIELLKKEGIIIINNKILNLSRVLHIF